MKNLDLSQNGQSLQNKLPSQSISVELTIFKKLQSYQKKHKFLITYDNCPEIRELYKWCNEISDQEWNYCISRTDDQRNGKKLKDGHKGRRYKGQELFIANYDIKSVPGLREHKFLDYNSNQLTLFNSKTEKLS